MEIESNASEKCNETSESTLVRGLPKVRRYPTNISNIKINRVLSYNLLSQTLTMR